MDYIKRVKERLILNAIKISETYGFKGVKRESAYLFNDLYMNFNNCTFDNISKNSDFKKRLDKQHTNVVDLKEMQSSNSSDALLMNIFAYPKVLKFKGLREFLDLEEDNDIIFGWNPVFENENKSYKTEIDLKIGNTIFESKLTESNFTNKKIDIIEKYSNVNKVFDSNVLKDNDYIENYQLIRNILTAYKYDFDFKLIIDDSRTDLIREFYKTKNAIKILELKDKINFITWQEITSCLGTELKEYIEEKYF